MCHIVDWANSIQIRTSVFEYWLGLYASSNRCRNRFAVSSDASIESLVPESAYRSARSIQGDVDGR